MNNSIAIVTLNHGVNYGNKLQNYAMQEVYRKLGYDVVTLRFFPKGAKVQKSGSRTAGYIATRLKRKCTQILYKDRVSRRIANFEAFNTHYLKLTDRCYTPQDYREIDEAEFDYFSVGSDQVWNSYFFDFCPFYLLDFVSDCRKKIAYAASFGVDSINPKYQQAFDECIPAFQAISVREERGKEIINNRYGTDTTVVLDPTLMLTSSDWDKLMVEKPVNYKYIFTYFLGAPSKEFFRAIHDFAKKKHCKIVEFNNLKNKFYEAGPMEFVAFIKNAEYVFTDSFHACCFSIQYKKRFWVVERRAVAKDMGSRIDTLLGLLRLEDRKWSDEMDFAADVDYNYAYSKLNEERAQSNAFLEKALGDRQ